MIKKIKTEQLRPGIFVHDFNCDWAGENIFISKALIKDERAIKIIRSWGIKEVYIDTDLGLDVEPAKTAYEVQQETNRNLHKLAQRKRTATPPPIPLKDEVQMARTIRNEAVVTMREAMRAVQEGKCIDPDNAFRLVEKMQESVTRNKDALILLTRIRKKDEYTLMHSISVSSLVLAFCSSCDISYDMTINLAMGSLFHDIGKTRIPNSILNKPGKLDQKEFTIMKKHAEYSAKVLAETTELPPEAHDIALHHHERYDGTGYPHGLKGDTIEFGSRIAAICDVYDAITSIRCYKNGLDRVQGLRKLYEWSDHYFDKELTYKFIRSIGVYPIGTYVRLANELSGVVINSTENILQPVVRIFYNDKKKTAMQIQEIDLSKIGINIAGYDSPEKWSSDKMHIFQQNKNDLSPLH
ncbi:MAG: HD-GYP domain-containing protein [Proteobacteria bacterium]|nr:HD-GYP domain-containing protein [Pseudomonadota bacterium]MBU1233379.1 HD-GYP domain-containing protein [Pseudomonadota bacterium]